VIVAALLLLLAGDRTRAEALAAQSEARAAAGDLAGAVRLLEKAAVEAPDWPELLANLAGLELRAGNLPAATQAARSALALAPDLRPARYNLGLAQFRSGDVRVALATLSPYIDDTSAPPEVHVALGLALAAGEQPAASASELDHALAAGVAEPAVLYALARMRRRLGQDAEARLLEERLAVAAPESAARYLTMGDARDRAQDWDAAQAAYRKAAELDPAFPGVHASLGMVLYKRHDYDAAAAAFDRELARHPDDAAALRYRALIELDRGNAAAAVPLLERAVNVAASAAAGWIDLGRARLAAGDSARAIDALRRAVGLAPDDITAHSLLAQALAAAGRGEESRKEQQRVLELGRKRKRPQEPVSGSPRPR
jgi:tetratricopeptide (TPR) repeat protein